MISINSNHIISSLFSNITFVSPFILGGDSSTEVVLANPIISADLLEEQMPGNIRKAKHFVRY